MTFEQMWTALVDRNPKLSDETATVTISAAEFKSALRQAFCQGTKATLNVTDKFTSVTDKFAKMFRDISIPK